MSKIFQDLNCWIVDITSTDVKLALNILFEMFWRCPPPVTISDSEFSIYPFICLFVKKLILVFCLFVSFFYLISCFLRSVHLVSSYIPRWLFYHWTFVVFIVLIVVTITIVLFWVHYIFYNSRFSFPASFCWLAAVLVSVLAAVDAVD